MKPRKITPAQRAALGKAMNTAARRAIKAAPGAASASILSGNVRPYVKQVNSATRNLGIASRRILGK